MQDQIDFNKDQVADLKIDGAVFEQKIIGIDRELGTVNEAVMMNTQFTTELHFSLKEEVADRKAEIFRIEQVQVTDREAAARWQEKISAEVSYNAAEILNIKDTQTSYEKATAQQISQVKAELGETNKEVGDIKGRVTTVETATADLKQAQAKFEQSTTAQFGEMTSHITNINQTITNIEFAVSEAIMQTTAQVNETNSELLKTKAEVTRLATATATNEKATAQLVESVKAQHEQSEAEFIDVRKSIAEKDKAQSERTEQVRAELGKDINANKDEIDKNKGELSKVSAAVTNNTQSIATLEETTTQIKQTQQSQYDETTANIGKLTETTASNTKAITEVKEQNQSRFENNEATIANMQQTIANAESSLSEMGMQLTAEVGNQAIEQLRIKASITRLDTVTADKFQAFAQSFEKIETQFNDVNSSITTLKKTVSDNEKSQAEVNELIKSEIGENKAAIEKRAETSVDQQGNSRAYFSIKAGVLHNGQYYDVKMMMSAQVKNGQVVTQIAFAADEFIIFNNANGQFVTPFAVVNGQVFIGSGFIQDSSITNAKIGNVIQSNDFKKGEKGWQIDKNGNPEFNDGTFRGKVYATDGDFRGTVHAEKFIGDVATGVLYKGVSKYFYKQSYMSIETSIIYVGGMPYDVDLILPTMHFASEHKSPAIHYPIKIEVFANGVSQNVITTTVDSPDTTWAAVASCYIKIPKMQKDTEIKIRLTGQGSGGDNSDCTLRIHPALILACKSTAPSFK
ncbi:DUF1983 domain-containing protein [Providencia rettgeri]|nr:DUF1983 domain-containing protein [Providencia rettgeri]